MNSIQVRQMICFLGKDFIDSLRRSFSVETDILLFAAVIVFW